MYHSAYKSLTDEQLCRLMVYTGTSGLSVVAGAGVGVALLKLSPVCCILFGDSPSVVVEFAKVRGVPAMVGVIAGLKLPVRKAVRR